MIGFHDHNKQQININIYLIKHSYNKYVSREGEMKKLEGSYGRIKWRFLQFSLILTQCETYVAFI